MLVNTRLELINEETLRELISMEAQEGRHIDFKRELKVGKFKSGPELEGDRLEFLRDVSSFANCAGGDLVFGMADSRGRACKLFPFTVTNQDAMNGMIHSAIDAHVEPRIPGIRLHWVAATEDGNSGHVLVLRIPQSFTGPHRVMDYERNWHQFWSRNSHGKYSLDTPEIRSSFLIGQSARQQVRNLRTERISRILSGDTPAPILDRPTMVFHIIPLALEESFDLNPLTAARWETNLMRPPGSGSYLGTPRGNLSEGRLTQAFNFDGLYAYWKGDYWDEKQNELRDLLDRKYLLILRSGALEYVDGVLLSDYHQPMKEPFLRNGDLEMRLFEPNQHYIVPSENGLEDSLRNIRRLTRTLEIVGVRPPLFCSVSLLHVRGLKVLGDSTTRRIDRDALLPPDFVVDSFDLMPSNFKSTFDILYQAAGQAGCSKLKSDEDYYLSY